MSSSLLPGITGNGSHSIPVSHGPVVGRATDPECRSRPSRNVVAERSSHRVDAGFGSFPLPVPDGLLDPGGGGKR